MPESIRLQATILAQIKCRAAQLAYAILIVAQRLLLAQAPIHVILFAKRQLRPQLVSGRLVATLTQTSTLAPSCGDRLPRLSITFKVEVLCHVVKRQAY